jgi:hypothetical protein
MSPGNLWMESAPCSATGLVHRFPGAAEHAIPSANACQVFDRKDEIVSYTIRDVSYQLLTSKR